MLTDADHRGPRAARPAPAQRRREAEYVHQVLGSSITLSTTTVPLAQRGLLGAGQVSTHLHAGRAAVRDGGRVRHRGRRGHPGRRRLAAAAARGRRRGRRAGQRPHADPAGRRQHRPRWTRPTGGSATSPRRWPRDPLGRDETDLAAVRALIDRADAERTSAGELREALTQRLADAHRLAGELDAAAAGGGCRGGRTRRAGSPTTAIADRGRARPAARPRRASTRSPRPGTGR